MNKIQWSKYEKTGREHLAECEHMSDTVGWPVRPDVKPVKGELEYSMLTTPTRRGF